MRSERLIQSESIFNAALWLPGRRYIFNENGQLLKGTFAFSS